jgi:hypothetical protein
VCDLGTLDVGALRSIAFTVLGTDGAPVDRARLYLGEIAGKPTTPLEYLTDKVGRATVMLPADARFGVFAAHETGFAVQKLEPGDANPAAVAIRLDPPVWLAGRVVDGAGAPLPRARIMARGAFTKQPVVVAGKGVLLEDRGGWPEAFLDNVNLCTLALDYRIAYAQGDGRFRLPFPMAGAKVGVSARLEADDGSFRRGDEVSAVLAAERVAELELVLRE